MLDSSMERWLIRYVFLLIGSKLARDVCELALLGLTGFDDGVLSLENPSDLHLRQLRHSQYHRWNAAAPSSLALVTSATSYARGGNGLTD